jgi:hypothetical protein
MPGWAGIQAPWAWSALGTGPGEAVGGALHTWARKPSMSARQTAMTAMSRAVARRERVGNMGGLAWIIMASSGQAILAGGLYRVDRPARPI